MKELLRLLFLKSRRGWLPSCWNKEEEADYYCKTKKRQHVECTAIVISEDNKIDYHGQSAALVGGLCYIKLIYYYWITGYDYTRSDQLLRFLNFYRGLLILGNFRLRACYFIQYITPRQVFMFCNVGNGTKSRNKQVLQATVRWFYQTHCCLLHQCQSVRLTWNNESHIKQLD